MRRAFSLLLRLGVADFLASLLPSRVGYDLKQLFIGAEGTLGVVTGVSIMTPRLPSVRLLFSLSFSSSFPAHSSPPLQAVNVAVLSVPTYEAVQTVFKETRARLGEILSAFEFWDQEGHDLVLHHTGAKSPFESEPEGGRAYYILVETSGSNKDHDDEVRCLSPPLPPFLLPTPAQC